MRRALAALVCLLLAAPAGAAETAQFLRILPGARPMAMGQAFTAVADDLNALTTNPSGLLRAGSRQAGFMHAELYSGARYDFLGYAQPAGPDMAFGFGVQRLAQAGIEGRDAAGGGTGTFGAADTAISAAGSFRLPDSAMMAGVGVKVVESRLAEASAHTVALDAGLLRGFQLGGLPMTLGAAARNMGPGLRLGDEREDLPLTVSLGASARFAGAVLLAVDVYDRPHARSSGFSVGTEYAVLPMFSMRAGYAAASASSSVSSPTGGLGFGFGLKLRSFNVDYGFTPAGELGAAQRISLTSRF